REPFRQGVFQPGVTWVFTGGAEPVAGVRRIAFPPVENGVQQIEIPFPFPGLRDRVRFVPMIMPEQGKAREDAEARWISARIESRQCGSDGRRAQGSLARPLRKQRRPRREYRFPYLPDDSRFRFHYRPFPSKAPAGPHPKYTPDVRRTPQCPRSPSMPAESGLHGTWCATCSYVHFTVAGEAAFS